jgi:hypothetical protein
MSKKPGWEDYGSVRSDVIVSEMVQGTWRCDWEISQTV